MRFRKIQQSSWWQLEELCEVPRCLHWLKGDWGITVLCTVLLVSCIVFNKCLYFSQYMAAYLLDRPCTPNIQVNKIIGENEKCVFYFTFKKIGIFLANPIYKIIIWGKSSKTQQGSSLPQSSHLHQSQCSWSLVLQSFVAPRPQASSLLVTRWVAGGRG